MANEIFIPFLNPVKLVKVEPVSVPQYLTKHFDEYLSSQILSDTPWIEQKNYYQKWQKSDTIRLQFESNFDPINVSLVNSIDAVVATVAAQNIRTNKYQAGLYIYEAEISLSAIEEGCYFLKVNAGNGILNLISEPMIIKEKHENTVLCEYRSSKYYADVIFETGILFTFRVEGFIGSYEPGGVKEVYEDEKLNPTILRARPYRLFAFHVGMEQGIPDWVIDKLNWIFGCDEVKLDDKYFSISEQDAFELKDEEGYPFKGLSIKLREGVNRSSSVFNPQGVINQRLVVVYNIERRLFGDVDGDGSNNTIPILNIE